MNAVLELLRGETRALHDAVESTPTMQAATARAGDADAHGDYLSALAVGVWPLVRAVIGSPGNVDPRLLPDASAWERLGADLEALGRPLPCDSRIPLPTADDDGAWGRLYVVRGAEAGVAALARQQARSTTGRVLPSTFASLLAMRRGQWPTLCAALAALPAPAARRAAAVAHADFHFTLSSITTWEHEKFASKVA